MDEFYKTRAGRQYLDVTLPALTEALNRMSKALESRNALEEKRFVFEQRERKEEKQINDNDDNRGTVS